MKQFLLLTVLLLLSPLGLAAQQAQIELADGSTLRGDLVGVANGSYRIRTQSLGIVTVNEADIVSLSIGAADAPRAPAAASTSSGQIQALQQGLMNDPQTLQMINGLMSDPQFQAILQDPAVLDAVNRGDMSALSRNPAILKLMNHPTVQAIGGRMGATR
jgi:hypothetical protein